MRMISIAEKHLIGLVVELIGWRNISYIIDYA